MQKLPSKNRYLMRGGNNLAGNLKDFFEHQIVIKMFHFNTQKYGWHKASDKYLEKFNANFDQLMEVDQGMHNKFGKINITMGEISMTEYPREDLKQNLDKMLTVVLPKIKDADPTYGAIVDIMMADIYQFKYLLKFN